MKVIYFCDCCEEIVEEIEVDEEQNLKYADSLTGVEGHDIINMAQGRVYFPTLCIDCFDEINLDSERSFSLQPKIH